MFQIHKRARVFQQRFTSGFTPQRTLSSSMKVASPQHSDEFWEELNTHILELERKHGAFPERYFKFLDDVRLAKDLDVIYDTLPARDKGASPQQRVKAFGDYPGLTHRPFHDPEAFPFVAELESKASTVRNELEAWLKENVENRGAAEKSSKTDDDDENAWTNNFFGESYGDKFHGLALVREGKRVNAMASKFPQTLSLLEALDIDGANRLAFFARQKAHSGVAPHSDCVNYLLTGHLGLVVPSDDNDDNSSTAATDNQKKKKKSEEGNNAGVKKCGMQVLGHEHCWREGEVVVFQNCFPHHTWNETSSDRILLYFDFWHPELSGVERKGIAAFERTRRKHERLLLDQQQQQSLEVHSADPFINEEAQPPPALKELLERLNHHKPAR